MRKCLEVGGEVAGGSGWGGRGLEIHFGSVDGSRGFQDGGGRIRYSGAI